MQVNANCITLHYNWAICRNSCQIHTKVSGASFYSKLSKSLRWRVLDSSATIVNSQACKLTSWHTKSGVSAMVPTLSVAEALGIQRFSQIEPCLSQNSRHCITNKEHAVFKTVIANYKGLDRDTQPVGNLGRDQLLAGCTAFSLSLLTLQAVQGTVSCFLAWHEHGSKGRSHPWAAIQFSHLQRTDSGLSTSRPKEAPYSMYDINFSSCWKK